MRKNYLEIGEIVGTHGVRGELRINPWSDTPDFLKNFKNFYFDKECTEKMKAVSVRPHGNIVLVKFEDIDNMDEALILKGKILYVDRKDIKLNDGYFIADLIDCTVYDVDTDKIYGILTDVSRTGANDVWHITNDDKEYLIPAIKDVVSSVDVDTGIIKIRPLRGIFEDED